MYPGLFRDYDNRIGKNWLAFIDAENRKVFGHIGYMACGRKRGFAFLPKVGGHCRAKTAKRNRKGQFIK